MMIFFPLWFILDFGFSGTYLDENGRAKPRELTRHHHGTPEYMGLAPLLNYTQVRKDDLISLGLTLLDVHGVTLPWMELPELDDIWAAMASVLGSWRTTDMEVSGLKAFNFNTHSPESVYLIQKQSIFRIYAGNQSHQKRSLDTSNIWIRSTHKIHQIMNI